MDISIHEQALIACRKLLSQINRDPATPTYGCFDRRFWGWKLTDFPEATFQRNAAALGWYLKQKEVERSSVLVEVIKSAILYSFKIQHKDGSFDQAYPNERSYGATAFLLPDLCSALEAIASHSAPNEIEMMHSHLRKSAEFLCKSSEQHGMISNHLAGAALGLQNVSKLLKEEHFSEKSREIIDHIITRQSDEGWYIEYGAADPGYQTLCMYYLAQIYIHEPRVQLKESLSKSLKFLQYFIHPDGTFGGEYGSRRTEVYYPGGIALLAKEFPIAAAMHAYMSESIKAGTTTTLMDIDFGNNAPLLHNYILAAENESVAGNVQTLPFEMDEILQTFGKAGLGVKGNKKYYVIYGASNGGVLKVFGKEQKQLILDDCGMLGEMRQKQMISTQNISFDNEFSATGIAFMSTTNFSEVNAQSPTPFNYLLLRLANLTFMRFTIFNEWIKKLMVKVLISNRSNLPLKRERKVSFFENAILVEDRITNTDNLNLSWLKQGIKFSAIHMASSRYYSPSQLRESHIQEFDCAQLNKTGEVKQQIEIDIQKGTVTKVNG